MKTPFLFLALGVFLAADVSAAPDFMSNRHVQMGMQCASCHGEKNEIAYPSIDQCRTCHDPKAVAEKTKDVKPQNPHVSPHYGNELDCVLCHVQHGETENYCDQCHSFKNKVP